MPVVTKRPPARRSCGSERNPAAAGMLDTEKKERVTWGLGEGGIMRDGETWREGEIRAASFLVW